MIVNKTLAVITLVGGTAQNFALPMVTDVVGDGLGLGVRCQWGSVKLSNTTAPLFLKFLTLATDAVASSTNFDVACGIVASTNNDETIFAIPATATQISVVSSAAVPSMILSIGQPE